MRLLRLKADGFGSLRGEFVFDPERLTLVVDRNERGKSTLLAAIAAALYGLEKDQRAHKPLTPLERWKPWDGGSYRVELDLEHAGETFAIHRDFTTQTVSVWDGRGRERTEEFREGKDEHPVGKHLLGLDAAEFEKCAFFKHGELDLVVPDEEKERRGSTLWQRLENAADTRVGDTNALEALQVIAAAASRYACPEVSENLIKVESAIQKLELVERRLETDVRALQADLEMLRNPLEQIVLLMTREQEARAVVARLEGERRATRVDELGDRLLRDRERRAELDRLRAEADDLRARPRLSADAESALVQRSGQLAEAERQSAEVARRREELAEERRALEAEAFELLVYEPLLGVDADGLAARARELRRLEDELQSARQQLQSMGAGEIDPARQAALAARFDVLSDEHREALRQHPRRMLAFQTRAATAGATRDEALRVTTTLEAERRRWSIPGWIGVGVGILGMAGAAAIPWLALPGLVIPWVALVAAGAVVLLAGVLALARARGHRRAERVQGHEDLRRSESDLSDAGSEQMAYQQSFQTLAAELGGGETTDLLDDWASYEAWTEQRRPAEPLEHQVTSLERQRAQLHGEIHVMLGAPAGEPGRVDWIDEIAVGVRRLAATRERIAHLERESGRLDEETQRNQTLIDQIHDESQRAFIEAGIAYRPEASLAEQLDQVRAAATRSARLAVIEAELAPGIASQLLDPATLETLERECTSLAGGTTAAAGTDAGEDAPAVDAASASESAARRSPLDIESQLAHARAAIEDLARHREELRARFEEKAHRCQAELAEKVAEREKAVAAHTRATRFKRALDLARSTIEEVAWETHRHWAAFLNERVGQILKSIGTDVLDVRFGEDLDFSIKLPNGQPVPRGRGVRQISSGASDQIHFAVRIAISEFLSRGRAPLPLLIDDCFATSDDERARAGMKLLIERLSQEHQVILVTCHRGRHEALAGLDRDVWNERVHWIVVGAMEADQRA